MQTKGAGMWMFPCFCLFLRIDHQSEVDCNAANLHFICFDLMKRYIVETFLYSWLQGFPAQKIARGLSAFCVPETRTHIDLPPSIPEPASVAAWSPETSTQREFIDRTLQPACIHLPFQTSRAPSIHLLCKRAMWNVSNMFLRFRLYFPINHYHTHTHTEGKQGVVQESKHSAINRRWSIYISGLSSVVRTLGLFAAVNLQSESTILTKLNATFERPLLPLLSDFQTQKTRFIFRLEENLLLRELNGCKTVVGLDLSLPGAAGPGRTDCPTANPEQLLQADRSRFQTTESFKVSPSHGRPRCFNDLVRDSSLFT